MPIFRVVCLGCGEEREVFIRDVMEIGKLVCESCGGSLQRVWAGSPPSIFFKDGGYYVSEAVKKTEEQ